METPFSEHFLEEALAGIQSRYPLRGYDPLPQPVPKPRWFERQTVRDLIAREGYERVENSEVDRYNQELQIFYERYREYLKESFYDEAQRRRAASLEIELVNDGTAPGEDIDIHLHFPDGVNLYSHKNLPASPKRPEPPQGPRTPFQIAMDGADFGLHFGHHGMPDVSAFGPPPNVSEAKIRRTNSYDVEINVKRLKHRTAVRLEPLVLVFESRETARSLGIQYRINASNVGAELTGELHIIVIKEPV